MFLCVFHPESIGSRSEREADLFTLGLTSGRDMELIVCQKDVHPESIFGVM